jgi:acyl transferase domain-containing protein/acyl carrier protein
MRGQRSLGAITMTAIAPHPKMKIRSVLRQRRRSAAARNSRRRSARSVTVRLLHSGEMRHDRSTPQPGRQRAVEPIAIVGMACRFPGASSPSALWRMLCAGEHALREVPADRWRAADFVDADRRAPGKMVTARGAFLDEQAIAGFDPEFFGISAREAVQIDPQQRMALELAWEALEHAGVPPDSLRGGDAGVFMGAMWTDYEKLHGLADIEQHSGTGWHLAIVSGRVSHALGLRGPSLSINTACSSSLVAVHLACASLRERESSIALAGGVSLMLTPHVGVAMSKFGGTSASGHCYAYDARADGYVRGEGGGVVVLRRYEDALAAGDRIHALIYASAVNNDGESDSLTSPSEVAQRQLLLDAYARAGVSPHEVAFVEGHGTGTAVGDPIEARAIGTVLGVDRRESLWLGSIKPNIGHTEAASGVASLIKATLALANRQIPPNLEFERPNPAIELERLNLRVPTRLEPLPSSSPSGRTFVGVNSFGFGGTNCHVVLGAAPEPELELAQIEDAPRLLVISASASAALDARIEQLHQQVLAGEVELADLAHTLWHRRTHLEHRAAWVASSLAELAELLARGPMIRARRDPRLVPKLAFAFSGQGSQWPEMGRDLLAFAPFRDALAHCSEILSPLLGWSPSLEIAAGTLAARIEHVDGIQPAIYAIQVALGQTLRSLGVIPDAVIGHSMGEVAAAVTAGAITIEDGARITCVRARLLRRIAGRGGMLALAIGARELEAVLAESTSFSGLSLAVDAGAASSVVSGDLDALARLRRELEARAIEVRDVAVDVAAHSPQIDALSDELLAAIADIRARPTSVRMFSSVSGAELDAAALTPAYWVRNLREHVQFASAAAHLLDAGHATIVELGPHPLLTWPLAQIAKARGQDSACVGSMRRGRSDRAQLLEAIAWLHCRGVSVELEQPGRQAALPPYPWQRRRFWPAGYGHSPPLAVPTGYGHSPPLAVPTGYGHSPPLAVPTGPARVGAEVPASGELDLVARFEPARVVELAGHAVGGRSVVAAGVVLELVLRALALQEPLLGRVRIEQLEFVGPLSGHASVVLELGGGSFSLRPVDAAACVVGRLGSPDRDLELPPPANEPTSASAEQHYRDLSERGVDYEPSLRAVESVSIGHESATVRVRPEQTRAALLDAAFQAVLAAVAARGERGSFVARRVESVTLDVALLATTREIHARVTSARALMEARAWLLDAHGAVVGTITGISLAALEREASVLQRLSWRVSKRASTPSLGDALIVFGGEERGSNLVAALLTEAGVAVRRCDRLDPEHEREPILVAFAGATETPPGPLEGTCEACARLIEALRGSARIHARTGRAPPVIVIAERARAVVPGEPVSLGGSALVGLMHVAAVEHPEIPVRVIDVGDLDDPAQRRELARALQQRDAPAWVALRSDDDGTCRSLLPTLTPERVPIPDWRAPAGTVIVSGGLGGIGRAVVHWLVERSVERVVVLGRRPLDDDGLAFLDSLASPARIHYLAVDVAELDELRLALADELAQTIGVIHSAAVLSDASLLEHDAERLRAALRPKLIGAWNLHELTRARALEFFVLFGSVGGWIGLPGQASYAAANAALDGLAEHRRGLGLAATSIGWCGWDGLGFARTPGGVASLERLALAGIGSLAPHDALALLDHLLAGEVAPAIAVMPPVSAAGTTRTDAQQVRQQHLRSLAPVKRRAEILERVLVEVAVVLREESQRIDPSRPLRELGLDSLMSVELSERLANTLGLATSTTLIWQHPSVDALVDHFVDLFTAPAPADVEQPDSLAAQIEALSDDEVEALMRSL